MIVTHPQNLNVAFILMSVLTHPQTYTHRQLLTVSSCRGNVCDQRLFTLNFIFDVTRHLPNLALGSILGNVGEN